MPNKQYYEEARRKPLTTTSSHRYDPKDPGLIHDMCQDEICAQDGFIKIFSSFAHRYPLLTQALSNCKPSQAKNPADCKCPGQIMVVRESMQAWVNYYYPQPPIQIFDRNERGTYELVMYFLARTNFMTKSNEESRCHAHYYHRGGHLTQYARNYYHGIVPGFYTPPPPRPLPPSTFPISPFGGVAQYPSLSVETKPAIPSAAGTHGLSSNFKAEVAGDYKPGVDRKPVMPSAYPVHVASSSAVKQEAYGLWDDRKPIVVPSSSRAPLSSAGMSALSRAGFRSCTTSSFIKQEPFDGSAYPTAYAVEDRKPVVPSSSMSHGGRTATARFEPYSSASPSRTSRGSRSVQVKPEPTD